jgi:hypothetical protein
MKIPAMEAALRIPLNEDSHLLKQSALLFDTLHIIPFRVVAASIPPEIEAKIIKNHGLKNEPLKLKMQWDARFDDFRPILAIMGEGTGPHDSVKIANAFAEAGIIEWIKNSGDADVNELASWWLQRDWPTLVPQEIDLMPIIFTGSDDLDHVVVIPNVGDSTPSQKLEATWDLCNVELLSTTRRVSPLLLPDQLGLLNKRLLHKSTLELSPTRIPQSIKSLSGHLLIEMLLPSDCVNEMSVSDILDIRSSFNEARHDMLSVYLNTLNDISKEAKPDSIFDDIERYISKVLIPKLIEFRREQQSFRSQLVGKLSVPISEASSAAALAAAGIGAVNMTVGGVGGTAAIALAGLAGAATKSPNIIRELIEVFAERERQRQTWMSYHMRVSNKRKTE